MQESKKLTQARLKELLHYDPQTGVFTWKVYRQSNAKCGKKAGGLSGQGYNRISIFCKRYLASRLAFLYMLGYFPEHEAEHKNRIRHDDRWSNLREATHMCNLRNVGVKCHNTSGVTGVGIDKKNLKWMAYITINGSFKNLGRFLDKTDAVIARWKAEKKYGFPNCQTSSSAYLYLKKNRCL